MSPARASVIECAPNATGSIDDPGPLLSESLDPLAVSRGATAGSGDLYSIVETSVAAGRSSIETVASVEATAPIGPAIVSGTGFSRVIAVLRVTDLVISGPGAEVEASLRFALDGSFELSAVEGEGEDALASVATLLGGGVCAPGAQLEFDGYLQVTDSARAGMSSLRNITDTDLLEGVELDAVTEFTRGPFTVPTGVPLQLEL